jgi:hypothetical protein
MNPTTMFHKWPWGRSDIPCNIETRSNTVATDVPNVTIVLVGLRNVSCVTISKLSIIGVTGIEWRS